MERPGQIPGTCELIPHESFRLVYEVQADTKNRKARGDSRAWLAIAAPLADPLAKYGLERKRRLRPSA